ncbi:N-acetylmuramoyl-L-alanine amidase family protein [Flavisolibacter ginsenosidimutans]|uniref:N-acetylmuramoyl-L-alanine amidase n=1 Tax=Flavisolibacter ginsenosidimutans TaxID=661481 RepID=A0A5B8UFK6_9BACT|nr:N-acetylmuramoyl-L-alanine amidase [Flavisolibacter ginsenosidimutans]QEC55461.1 N-acetylmuramoyl-L-alanine amidase [Flavisolibacter ginsenosidimutans]
MLKKTFLIVTLFSVSALLTSFAPPKKDQQVIKTIIIDAGHGIMDNGNHNGARGSYSYEDDICLAVAKKLVAKIRDQYPDIKIVETRPTENIVALKERANIANRNHGDLFVSIHVNAMPPIHHKELVGYEKEVYYTGKGKKKKKHTRKVPQYRYYTTPNTHEKGTQTYIWGAHKAEDKELAVRENAQMLEEDNYKQTYGDIDPNSPEFVALSLVKTKQYSTRSAMLSNMVEEQFSKVGRISGGPMQRQVGIWVLQATAMPSILVETGFITNPDEEKYLNSENGQFELADCITKAVGNYMKWLEKRQNANGPSVYVPATPATMNDAFLQALNEHHNTPGENRKTLAAK